MSHFKSKLGKIHYHETGTGDKTLIMIHDILSSSEIFKSHLKYFREEFKIIIPDLPGHGLSDRIKKFPSDYYEQCAEILLDFLKDNKEEKVNIVGISGGAIIAMIMASKDSSRIRNVVANGFPGKKLSNGNLDLMIEETKKEKKNIFNRFRLKQLHGKSWRDLMDNYIDFLEKLKYNDSRVIVPKIKKIDSRVLLTGSSSDNLVPRLRPIYRKLHKKFPHFNVLLFYSGKYPSSLTRKRKYRREILEFLKT